MENIHLKSRYKKKKNRLSPLYVVLIGLVGLVRGLDVVAFTHHGDVALHVTFASRCYVSRIRQHGPLVVELMLWKAKKKNILV